MTHDDPGDPEHEGGGVTPLGTQGSTDVTTSDTEEHAARFAGYYHGNEYWWDDGTITDNHTGAEIGHYKAAMPGDVVPHADPHALSLDPGHHVVGTPEIDRFFWQPQTTAFTCAVMAQRGIIEAFTDEPVSEAQLVYEATAEGMLSDGGMSPGDVGKLLESHGVPCHAVEGGAAVGDLVAELALGHKVIVGVDAGELWGTDSGLEDLFRQAADHAIWVTGVDLGDPDHPKVIINDSGDPDGCGKAYDLGRFVDAWQDSGFTYVATDQAPPGLATTCADFDAETGTFAGLVDGIREHVPEFLAYGGAAAAGTALGVTAVGSVASSGTAVDAGADTARPKEPARLPPPTMANLDQTARDRLFDEI